MLEKKYIIVGFIILLFSATLVIDIRLWNIFHELRRKLEARIPKKGYISVPAAAFVPQFNNMNIMNVKIDRELYNYGNGRAYFVGSVQLPHGATVTNVTWYFYDGGDRQIWLNLVRYNQTSVFQVMTFHLTQGTPGYGIGYGEHIESATVDNSQWAYCLTVSLPPSATHTDYRIQCVIIEYEYPA